MSDCSQLVKYLEFYLFADSIDILITLMVYHQVAESRVRDEQWATEQQDETSPQANAHPLRSIVISFSCFDWILKV